MAKTKEKKTKTKIKSKAKPEPDEPSTSATKTGAGSSNGQQADSGIWQDARFQHLIADPRFRGVPKVQRKVKIDKRFEGMFTDDKFKVKYTVDKYGRPVNRSNAEDLKKFYELDEEESSSEEEKKEQRKEEKALIEKDSDEEDEEDTEMPQSLRERLTNPQIDYARGEGALITDSSSDEEDEQEDDAEGPELKIDHVWGELDNDAESTEESSRRLAVCNMDWDRIRAEDLMVLLSSFLPPGGSVLSVKIYPSEYGRQRMKEEEIHGPTELVKGKQKEYSDTEDEDDLIKEQDSDAEEGEDYHMEKLRQYQLNRLRYYYAVVELDSVDTADKIYKECDGIEYESSATRVDLRFIPDETKFEEETPTDECYELPEASSYRPRQFTTTALQQAKVDLTWDETDLTRRELGDKLSSGQVDKLNDRELRQIVAYSSEEEEEEVEKEEEKQEDQKQEQPLKSSKQQRIDKYKSLLAEINQQEQEAKEQKYEMEMSWNIVANEDQKPPQQLPTKAEGSSSHLTPIEKVMLKRSEKNKQRKAQRRLKKSNGSAAKDSDEDSDSSLPDGIDLNDAYFAEEFAQGDYQPVKTKTKSKSALKKLKKLAQPEPDDLKQQQELALLLDEDQDEKPHFNLNKILKEEQQEATGKRKRRHLLKKKQEKDTQKPDDDFQVNLNDSRFKAVYKSHEFNIDPTHSHYKATKGMQQFIGEKLKRRQQQVDQAAEGADYTEETTTAPKRSKQQLEQSALVKSLKRKIQQQGKV